VAGEDIRALALEPHAGGGEDARRRATAALTTLSGLARRDALKGS
jgi:hypothetical protein